MLKMPNNKKYNNLENLFTENLFPLQTKNYKESLYGCA